MIPVILALTFSILLTLVFVIPGIFLCIRWPALFVPEDSKIGDMKIPNFYATEPEWENFRDAAPRVICMSVVGGVFGGIHCAGRFFTFPSSDEAMLWWVASAVLTGVAILLPIIFVTTAALSKSESGAVLMLGGLFPVVVFSILLLVYVVSRLLLLVEAFISLRHLTPGMLALVKWTSFIAHI